MNGAAETQARQRLSMNRDHWPTCCMCGESNYRVEMQQGRRVCPYCAPNLHKYLNEEAGFTGNGNCWENSSPYLRAEEKTKK